LLLRLPSSWLIVVCHGELVLASVIPAQAGIQKIIMPGSLPELGQGSAHDGNTGFPFSWE